MAVFRDPRAPNHRVVFGGIEFIDGLTADIELGPETLRLFASAGITEASPALSPKETLQAAAAELGLNTDGTKADLQARIDEHRTAITADSKE